MAEIEPRQQFQRQLRRIFGHEPSPEQVAEILQTIQGSGLGEGQFDRIHRQWNGFQKTLGNAAIPIIQWLIKQRVLFRGAQIQCPNCGFRRWHPINRLAETFHCDGCQVTSPIPIPPDKLEWRYRLNEIVGRAVDQGVLPHLLALRRMAGWATVPNADLLGYLPGVVFRPLEQSDRREIEVDLLAVKNGKIIIGECKESGGSLQGQEVSNLSDLAQILKCSRVIYATPKDFGGAEDVIALAQETSGLAQIELWGKSDLLDVDPRLSTTYTTENYLKMLIKRL